MTASSSSSSVALATGGSGDIGGAVTERLARDESTVAVVIHSNGGPG